MEIGTCWAEDKSEDEDGVTQEEEEIMYSYSSNNSYKYAS